MATIRMPAKIGSLMPALLFDLDGTLADTKPDLYAAMNYVLTKHGLDPVKDGDVEGSVIVKADLLNPKP